MANRRTGDATPQRGLDSPRERYSAVRGATEQLAKRLEPEDLVAQSMPDASPVKWHLAHTTWFFETFVLERYSDDYQPHHPAFRYLFNSYYNAVGERHPRPLRGVLTRPTAMEVWAYRAAVDEAMGCLLESAEAAERPEVSSLVELGLHHEQQHQELILTDLKHLFSLNVLAPAYREALAIAPSDTKPPSWIEVPEGVYRVGHEGPGFAFDNEQPRHRAFVQGFSLASRLVTNGEFLAFIEAGGYARSDLWLDEGWARVLEEGWERPLYWRGDGGERREFTLAGERELALDEPVSHVSFLEADAYARWAGARLPSEAEWEVACGALPVDGNFVESGRLHPAPARPLEGVQQAFGDLWEWTQSSYGPYPGFRVAGGEVGEYNGKFMCNQLVLRGGSCASPRSHLRASYRNFFHAPDRWQFSGFRLARDV